MLLTLQPHPDSEGSAVSAIEVEALRRGPTRLDLRYRLRGRLGEVVLPGAGAPERADELWRSTCFEAFLRPPEGEAYVEVNVSPSRQWAVYGFQAYRDGMAPVAVRPPVIGARPGRELFELAVSVDLGPAHELPALALWRTSLSAIIEQQDGQRSWWALAHSAGEPDFHHLDSFALDLPPSEHP